MTKYCRRIITFLLCSCFIGQSYTLAAEQSLRQIITQFSSFEDRHTGTEGYDRAAEYILGYLEELGYSPQEHNYPLPVRKVHRATIQVGDAISEVQPFLYNAITPQAIDESLEGPLYYVSSGTYQYLKGKKIEDSIILMDFDSGFNWQEVAALGAKACIFVQKRDQKSKFLFQEKFELSPIQFPIFWMSWDNAQNLFGAIANEQHPLDAKVTLRSKITWHETIAKNIYTLVPGSDPELKDELIVIDAFFDNSSYLPGKAPGADEATSIATLLRLAAKLKENPPGRSVLLLATSGHAQTLAGLREFIWAASSRSKDIRGFKKLLRKRLKEAKANYNTLSDLKFPLSYDVERDEKIKAAINNNLKSYVDQISRELGQLRMDDTLSQDKSRIDNLVERRFNLRQLGWAERYDTISAKEQKLLTQLIPKSMEEHKNTISQTQKHLDTFASSQELRAFLGDYSIAAFISLHLSSHGNGIGGFHEGWLYQLRPRINRTGIYSEIGAVLRSSSEKLNSSSLPYVDTLRGDRLRDWDSWFLGKPFHGGEVSSIAGYLGLTLATLGDARHLWGTPWDGVDQINWNNLDLQEKLIFDQIREVSWAERLSTGRLPRRGFSSVTGRANLLLQGELFANFPATQTTIMAYQGKGRFYAMVDAGGYFHIRGVSDKKNVVDKVIIEGYRFDENSGKVLWAIDKKETGKSNYRVKMQRQSMKTDLILFSCTETTIFGLLEPRNFKYLTKVEILDGRRDAPPQHYWYSRIDTRVSTISSFYTEPGTWLKLTLSDTVLTRKMILSNSSAKNPGGYGYPVDKYAKIPNTPYYAARDIWSLLKPRINNLEKHGIVDQQINSLQKRGLAALDHSTTALEAMDYGEFKRSSLQALALAGRVYVQVEKTQKDVLFGVLFYIALFVPFAFCIERFIFNYANIYKRITAFTLLLVALIAIIYNVHPAFQLAYSPTVIILAFFIIGLSLMVTLIIFFRFEEEMILMQRRTTHMRPAEISQWKAFVAAFFLGVSNLRRRRLRTILTCLTLIILTFTIMSFTTVKSNQKPNRLLFQDRAPYSGVLLKTMNWKNLPRQGAQILRSAPTMDKIASARVWYEGRDVTKHSPAPITYAGKSVETKGLLGLSPVEIEITPVNSALLSGRWFTEEDRHSILLSNTLAEELGLSLQSIGEMVSLWGIDYKLVGIFDSAKFDDVTDLDGESLTPVIFPQEVSAELTEVEQEAMESGSDVRTMQSRYQHLSASQVAIIPAWTLFAMGGQLKSVAIKPLEDADVSAFGEELVDRFNLPIFVGEDNGVWFFSPSSTLSYKGVPNIVIPLLISIFIVLNTMISSVYERKSEISVYTSVGLAPTHVSFLFIAEAMALAVISVVLGYLLAQVSAALFSTTNYWQGITVNYSSMAGVAAMLLVIAVVLISVIYPSRVAAQIAIPDVRRSFSLPKPHNNAIEVMLPFFMNYEEHESIGGYIYSYFKGHQDISHGLFSTGPVQIIFSCATVDEIQQMILHADDPSNLHCTHIRAKVWLAPFDFGIMQEVDIQFCPARESSNYLEIKITLRRNSGEMSMWRRLNTMFIHDLRKQLLIWRSIDISAHKSYQEKLREALNQQRRLKPLATN